MKELVCITCPNSCHMQAELENGQWKVTGNKCKRGQQFAESEMTCPKRTFSTTVKTAWDSVPVIPVRVSREIPKDKIFQIMEEINHMTVRKSMGRGDVLIPDVLGFHADVIVTSSVLKEYLEENNKENTCMHKDCALEGGTSQESTCMRRNRAQEGGNYE